MKRIGIDYRPVTLAPHSGIARLALGLVEALRAMPGIEVVLFSDGPADHADRRLAIFPAGNVSLATVRRPHRRLWYEHVFLPRAARMACVDVFITTANTGLPAPLRHDMRRVAWIHDLFPLTLPDQYRSLRGRVLYHPYYRYAFDITTRYADHIITPSQYTASECVRIFPRCASRIRVLPNLVPRLEPCGTPVLQKRGIPPGYWLMVGSPEPRKNMAFFIRAWLNASKYTPDLVIIAERNSVPEDLLRQGGRRLHVCSELTDGELATFYSQAARLWQPSLAEGFGLPVVEAMSFGTPVAVAAGSALEEVVPPGTPRFDPHDGPALAEIMQRLCEVDRVRNAEQSQQLQEWARRYSKPFFERNVQRLAEFW